MLAITGGVWPAMFTPCHEDQSPNYDVIPQLVELFVEQKLGGIYLLGSTGQGAGFSNEDRKRVTEATIKAADGRLPVMVHVGAVATIDSVELAKHAADAGADGISSVPPIYFPATPVDTFLHYELIAGATNVPFFPYHASFMGGSVGDLEAYGKRLLALPNIGGMKVTDHDLYVFGQIKHYTQSKLTLFSGADPLVCQAAMTGADGAIGTYYNVFGEPVAKAREGFMAGDIKLGMRFMETFQKWIGARTSSSGIYPVLRQLMKLAHGIDIGPARVPRFMVGEQWPEAMARQMIDEVYTAAGLEPARVG